MSPSVVTIHDCIHLMFPQYLPNRRSYLYARTMMWAAAKRADAILTVSEASKRDILRFFDVKPEKVVVVHNAIDERFWTPPAEEDLARVRERYQLEHGFVLYAGNIKPHKNLVRLIEAFDEIRRGDFEEMKLLILGDEISKMPALRRAVHQHHLHKHVRFLGYVSDETLASPLPAGRRVRVPVNLRGVRPAAARGHGLRRAGGNVERLVTARSHRRRGGAGESARHLVDRAGRAAGAVRSGVCEPAPPARAGAGARSSHGNAPWPRRGISTNAWPRASGKRGLALREGSAGSRLADRHARGRKGPRGAVPALSRRQISSPCVHQRGSVSPTIESRRITTSFVQRLPLRHDPVPPLPAALPHRDRTVQPRRLRPGDQLQPLRRQVRDRARARLAHLLLPLADALRLGSVRRVFRAGARRAGRRAAGSTGRCWRGWPAGTPPPPAASTVSWPTRRMLRGAFADTMIASR